MLINYDPCQSGQSPDATRAVGCTSNYSVAKGSEATNYQAPGQENPYTAQSAAGAPAELALYDTELHSICDSDVQAYAHEIEDSNDPDPQTQALRKSLPEEMAEWRGWKGFPNRWRYCRNIERGFCQAVLQTNQSEVSELYLRYYAKLKRPTAKQTQLAAMWAQSAKETELRQASCEKIKQLDSLIQRVETTVSAHQLEIDKSLLRAPEPFPDSTLPHPVFISCKPTADAGFSCDSD